MNEKLKSFEKLLNIMDELRVKCPWDKSQTFDSIRTLTIEEVYELSESIFEKNFENVKKELGDILLHIVFYSKMGSEEGYFDIKDVIDALNNKLIFRHPHVFGDVKLQTAKEVEESWENLKLKEKDGNKSVLSGIPQSLPALIKAFRIQDKARGVGFDWEKKEQVWDKVAEELEELKIEIKKNDTDKIKQEFGDLLFAVINAARLYDVHPEDALEMTNRKFIKRFNYLEENTIKKGKDLKKMTLEEMDFFWNKAKDYE